MRLRRHLNETLPARFGEEPIQLKPEVVDAYSGPYFFRGRVIRYGVLPNINDPKKLDGVIKYVDRAGLFGREVQRTKWRDPLGILNIRGLDSSGKIKRINRVEATARKIKAGAAAIVVAAGIAVGLDSIESEPDKGPDTPMIPELPQNSLSPNSRETDGIYTHPSSHPA